ncbi:hypothetical protein EBBID32_650 [Sphingobium indicum BiD32]|uniref:Uncharacterized protein n=1 Tax=Sphingobium indicum BiD32 TaxID=1301087 RepID=N1MJB7_9SPHN|nr:DUF6326 family protein [Sphingobium indicum]CCW15737.1 hypothetical protein EBBID32_650 [Sphingobium indicum BiD32]
MPSIMSRFQDPPVSTRVKLSAMWASLMFCYVYGDYFGLYVPGKVMAMNAGLMAFGQLTPVTHVAVAVMMAIPSLMVAFSLFLPPLFRWLHVVLALAYAAIMLLTMQGGAPAFYIVLGVTEIMLSLAIFWTAFRWPRVTAAGL